MIVAINYADKFFERNRTFNTKSAYIKGRVDKVIEYGPSDIDKKFWNKHSEILTEKRGAGLWLWKPYIIYKTLEILADGDYLIYSDAGSIFIQNVIHLIRTMEKDKTDIMVFELPLLSTQWTKRECFQLMNSSDYDTNQILASYIVLRNSCVSKKLVYDWLSFACDIRILSPKRYLPKINEFEDFVSHREDQSILSVLCHKNKITPYRDPSQFGKRPWEYASDKWFLREKKYDNSPYPMIIVSNRSANPIKFLIKETIKSTLFKLGIWTKTSYYRRRNITEKSFIENKHK